tara:strand:+ start:2139 stop:2369 length:231 start_codon:yes stop_codon:yes gene_type:complete
MFALSFFKLCNVKKTCLNAITTDDKHLQKCLNIEDKTERVEKIYENNEKRNGDYWVFLGGRRSPSSAAGSLSGRHA